MNYRNDVGFVNMMWLIFQSALTLFVLGNLQHLSALIDVFEMCSVVILNFLSEINFLSAFFAGNRWRLCKLCKSYFL